MTRHRNTYSLHTTETSNLLPRHLFHSCPISSTGSMKHCTHLKANRNTHTAPLDAYPERNRRVKSAKWSAPKQLLQVQIDSSLATLANSESSPTIEQTSHMGSMSAYIFIYILINGGKIHCLIFPVVDRLIIWQLTSLRWVHGHRIWFSAWRHTWVDIWFTNLSHGSSAPGRHRADQSVRGWSRLSSLQTPPSFQVFVWTWRIYMICFTGMFILETNKWQCAENCYTAQLAKLHVGFIF
jgi:hypothetical protein